MTLNHCSSVAGSSLESLGLQFLHANPIAVGLLEVAQVGHLDSAELTKGGLVLRQILRDEKRTQAVLLAADWVCSLENRRS